MDFIHSLEKRAEGFVEGEIGQATGSQMFTAAGNYNDMQGQRLFADGLGDPNYTPYNQNPYGTRL